MRAVVSCIRLSLMAGLLTECWYHSHWSVALVITLLSIETEIRQHWSKA